MSEIKVIFKKVPKNEVGKGTEISILKKYFDDGIIDDPKDLQSEDINIGSKSYPIKVIYKNTPYDYSIKAYETQNYSKDRRMILGDSNDPLGTIRETDDFLCYVFKGKITKNSKVYIH